MGTTAKNYLLLTSNRGKKRFCLLFRCPTMTSRASARHHLAHARHENMSATSMSLLITFIFGMPNESNTSKRLKSFSTILLRLIKSKPPNSPPMTTVMADHTKHCMYRNPNLMGHETDTQFHHCCSVYIIQINVASRDVKTNCAVTLRSD